MPLFLYDSYREAKAHCNAKNLVDQIPNLGALKSVKCNANGNQVSILISQVNGCMWPYKSSQPKDAFGFI